MAEAIEMKVSEDKDSLTVKVPFSTTELLEKLKQETGKGKSDIVSEAIVNYVDPKDEFELIARALKLCPACRADFKKFAESSGRSLTQVFRYEIWKYFGEWNHGEGCPTK